MGGASLNFFFHFLRFFAELLAKMAGAAALPVFQTFPRSLSLAMLL